MKTRSTTTAEGSAAENTTRAVPDNTTREASEHSTRATVHQPPRYHDTRSQNEMASTADHVTASTIEVAGTGASRAVITSSRPASRASSVRSYRSTTSVRTRIRMAEYEAEAELARINAELIKKRLAVQIAELEDEEENAAAAVEPSVNDRVDNWLTETRQGDRRLEPPPPNPRGERVTELHRAPRHLPEPAAGTTARHGAVEVTCEDGPRHPGRAPLPPHGVAYDNNEPSTIDRLVGVLECMSKKRPLPRQGGDLPTYSGSTEEWLPFKAAMTQSTKLYEFTPADNLVRLNNCLKGEAREAVSALLHTAEDPGVIMKTLEQCFGRPEVIADKVLREVRQLPRVGQCATELNKFAIKVQNYVCVMNSINKRGLLSSYEIVRVVVDKLSPHLRGKWVDYASENASDIDDIEALSRFLMREADRSLKYLPASTSTTQPPCPVKKEKRNTKVFTTTSSEAAEQCVCCGSEHVITKCPKFKSLDANAKWAFVKKERICFLCLLKKHRRSHCRASPCPTEGCGRPHHVLLHTDKHPSATSSTSVDTAASSEAVLASSTRDNTVLMKVCPVVITGPGGDVETYALLDEAATVSLIDTKLAQQVHADGPSSPLTICGVNMRRTTTASKRCSLKVRGKIESESHDITLRTVDDLSLCTQTVKRGQLNLEHLSDLEYKDYLCYESVTPRVLIGADYWHLIVSRELRAGRPTEPAASRTLLGWVVHGKTPRVFVDAEVNSVMHTRTTDSDLDTLIRSSYAIENLGVSPRVRVNKSDERAVNMFEDTVTVRAGHYIIGLPWKHDAVQLPPSYAGALKRLNAIESKMDKDSDFSSIYNKEIKNLIDKGYAVKCDGSEDTSDVAWYLPHFAVRNPHKPGKVRLVFDAAAQIGGTSLNENLLDGPDLLQSLVGIMFRFREKAIALTADIAEMFLRIKVREEDQPAQMFLWREGRRDPPTKFKMTSLIFGARCSPFIAHSVRNKNAHAHAAAYPDAARAITSSHYMDDYIDSVETETEAIKLVADVTTVHAAAAFDIRSWNSNSKAVRESIPAEKRAQGRVNLISNQLEERALGLQWDPEQDTLGFNTRMPRVPTAVRMGKRPPTKREMLSAVMSLYDPLGLLSHYTITAKITLQQLWRLRTGWDDHVPEEESERFDKWLKRLNLVETLRLPRCYVQNENITERQLHIFCDASEQAYAAVAYWRLSSATHGVRVVLAAARAKVAPLRPTSIPRLELQAAVLGARLANLIQREHQWQADSVTYWSDYRTVIQWIRSDAKQYTPFVAHRLGELDEETDVTRWRWLPTKDNVADEATRADHERMITSDDRWFRGPDFLYQEPATWPCETSWPATNEERVLTTSIRRKETWLPDISRFSSYDRLIRTTAYVLLAVERLRGEQTSLSVRHLKAAREHWIRQSQEETFCQEKSALRRGAPVPKASKLANLNPVEEDGVLRLGGRIGAAQMTEDQKRPVILDGRHPFTRLLVHNEHSKANHANNERVVNNLRQQYWVVHLRPTVRAVARECQVCRVRNAIPVTPSLGDLPAVRVERPPRAFTFCGVDYFGPLSVTIGRRHEKRWVALFTCLSTRAVHLEMASSLSTDSAIMTLRRMAARRGWPQVIYSDNATNFRGADAELRAAYKRWAPELRDYALQQNTDWRFIPPGAPHMGGAWERLVRSVKTALTATLRERHPKEEVLMTLITEAEHSVNSRPLTHVPVNPDDPEALTPNHFLIGASTGLPATGSCNEADKSTWKKAQALADMFWRRWLTEYVPTLAPRGRVGTESQLQVGDLVIVTDKQLPRNVWPRGRIEKVFPGPDGKVRVAEVQTRAGTFRRPASRLAVLNVGATRSLRWGEDVENREAGRADDVEKCDVARSDDASAPTPPLQRATSPHPATQDA